MSIQIADVKTEIQITHTGISCFLNKSDIELDTAGDLVIFYYQNNPASPLFEYDQTERSFVASINWGQVTVPVCVSAIDLQAKIQAMIQSSVVIPISGNTTIFNEVPAGVIDGVNMVFTTAEDFTTAKVCVAPPGGALTPLMPVTDYSQTDTDEVTLTYAPETGSIILMDYIKA